MAYIDFDCPLECWKCHESCEIRTLMIASIQFPELEQIFYDVILDNLHASAGQILAQGLCTGEKIDQKQLDDDIKRVAVGIYITRQRMEKYLSKKKG